MISIIIINYNTFQITSDCIRSVLHHANNVEFEIILVDNASVECEPSLFLKEFPMITLVKSPSNLGFSKGNNLGISHAKGDYILLLNSDTVFVENTLERALCAYKQKEGIGFLGVKMIYPDGRIQHTARKFRTIKWEILDLFRFIVYFLPYKKRSTLMLGRYFKGDYDTECDWLNGAFLFFKRSILELLPQEKLDERFFMYGEDHLWGYQLTSIGLKNEFISDTNIIHINNASTLPSKRISLLKTIFKNELKIMEVRKGKGLYYFVFLFLYGSKEWFRIFIKSLKWSFKNR